MIKKAIANPFKMVRLIAPGIVIAFVVGVLGGCNTDDPEPTQVKQATAAREHQVEIKGLNFVPATIDVNVGDTVTWTNRDFVPHTATASDKSWDTGAINKDESKSVVIGSGMETDYFCIFHPNMEGSMTLASD